MCPHFHWRGLEFGVILYIHSLISSTCTSVNIQMAIIILINRWSCFISFHYELHCSQKSLPLIWQSVRREMSPSMISHVMLLSTWYFSNHLENWDKNLALIGQLNIRDWHVRWSDHKSTTIIPSPNCHISSYHQAAVFWELGIFCVSSTLYTLAEERHAEIKRKIPIYAFHPVIK